MGALLEAVATSTPGRGEAPSSTRLAVAAAQQALRTAGRSADDVNLLVNAGVYRDGNVLEPANATFVQHEIGANLEWASVRGAGTLSFDVVNGGCGVLSALQVVNGFIATGAARHGLVVASDVDPAPGLSRGYDHLPVGAGLVLGPGQDSEGFQAFDLQTYGQYAALNEATLTFTDGAHVLTLREDPSYQARALECAADAVLRFLDKQGRDAADIDLVAGWPFADALPAALTERVGFAADQFLDLPARPIHTAGIATAIQAALARRTGLMLFVAVGSGITVATALYRCS